MDGFEILDQNITSNWAAKLEDGIYYMMPKNWLYEDFLGELEDKEPKAMDLFKTESEIIYHEAGWMS